MYAMKLCAMTERKHRNVEKSQSNKFKEAARELEADESEAHWDERLKRVVKLKPVPTKPPLA